MAGTRTIRLDLVLLLLLMLRSTWAEPENKCSNLQPQCPDSGDRLKFNFDLVPNILVALQDYTPCSETQCICYVLNIRRDLESYAVTGITQKMINQSRRFGTLYKVLNGRLYRHPDCTYPSRCANVEHFLLDVVTGLPNMEFVLNVCDWPQVHFLSGLSGPVLSYSITSQHLDIMYPAWSFWSESGPTLQLYPLGIGRWDLMRHHLSAVASRLPWKSKKPIAFFRGSRSSKERDSLVLLSQRKPDLVDAQYTRHTSDKSTSSLDAELVPEMPFSGHCGFKYLFNFRGVTASFRFRHILLCKSLVLHVGEEWQEFFYIALKPWVHYVPVSSNATAEDLEELILYLRLNDELAEQIAQRGYDFIWNHLKMRDVECYWRQLLLEYAKLMTYDAQLEPEFYEVTHTALQHFWNASIN
ncbi:O-glucosyltransferase rumi isoform X2 [Scaptodrosophila lebanonensis]|uniref:O-glucosyltransferase rumi isoform X2 n=1 Tax=Drosophila lebanonensis TaxID=7225 RepID=A0A6J2T715_DROLE|nr:O-glucosyltransferase rumi isoform X2 [Scaptodrosophila lebanonensis]